jgi:hypothetical protein
MYLQLVFNEVLVRKNYSRKNQMFSKDKNKTIISELMNIQPPCQNPCQMSSKNWSCSEMWLPTICIEWRLTAAKLLKRKKNQLIFSKLN